MCVPCRFVLPNPKNQPFSPQTGGALHFGFSIRYSTYNFFNYLHWENIFYLHFYLLVFFFDAALYFGLIVHPLVTRLHLFPNISLTNFHHSSAFLLRSGYGCFFFWSHKMTFFWKRIFDAKDFSRIIGEIFIKKQYEIESIVPIFWT